MSLHTLSSSLSKIGWQGANDSDLYHSTSNILVFKAKKPSALESPDSLNDVFEQCKAQALSYVVPTTSDEPLIQ